MRLRLELCEGSTESNELDAEMVVVVMVVAVVLNDEHDFFVMFVFVFFNLDLDNDQSPVMVVISNVDAILSFVQLSAI